jgi:hypothetical protein
MNPDLERLLEAYDAKLTCEPEAKRAAEAVFEKLLANALARQPGTSREALLEALRGRFADFCRARRQFPTLPPQA